MNMNDIMQLVNLVSVLAGAVGTILVVLVKAKIIKGKEVDKLINLLEKGHDITEALSQTRLNKGDVEKVGKKKAEKIVKRIEAGINKTL